MSFIGPFDFGRSIWIVNAKHNSEHFFHFTKQQQQQQQHAIHFSTLNNIKFENAKLFKLQNHNAPSKNASTFES